MMRYFYLGQRAHSNGNSLKGNPRIMKFDSLKMAIYPSYVSLEELTKKDEAYIKFKKQRPKTAKTISQEKHVHTVTEYVLTPSDFDEKNLNWNVLSHTIEGNRDRKSFTGVHHLEFPLPSFIDDYEELMPENSLGVYVAKFAIIDNGRKLTKETPSTMFPRTWTKQQLLIECKFAFEHKQSVEGSTTSFISKTISGVPVEIHLRENGSLRTIYPIRL